MRTILFTGEEFDFRKFFSCEFITAMPSTLHIETVSNVIIGSGKVKCKAELGNTRGEKMVSVGETFRLLVVSNRDKECVIWGYPFGEGEPKTLYIRQTI